MWYTLGDYTLDTQRYEICRAGIPLPLQPKVLELLVYLIQHRDRVVTRQELFDTLWPEQFVSDDALEWLMAAARRAVGDSGRAQRVIKTIRSRGYRCVAAVEEHPQPRPEAARLPAPAPDAAESPAVSPGMGGERKQVTVLACSLSAVVTQAEGMEPETLHTMRQRFFALAQQAVQRYAGTLQHVVDNVCLAFFGAPMAQEDHARRAVLAALHLQAGLRHPDTALASGTTRERAVCMSVHTGEVIVGPIGTDLRQIALAVGDTTQMAEQLLRLAEPGAIVLSAAACQLVQDFVRLDLVAPVHVPGLSSHHPALEWQGRRVVRYQGWALVAQGQGEEGVAQMHQGIARFAHDPLMGPYARALLTEACTHIGQTEEGWEALTEALNEVEQGEGRFYTAELYRLKGDLLLHQAITNAPQAEACFQQALDLARQSQAKWWELRAATSLARLWQSQDKHQDAYDLLAPVYGWFTEGFDTPDLQDAQVLLRQLSSTP